MRTRTLMFVGLLAFVVSGAPAAWAQPPASPPKGPTLEERLAARAAENRYAVSFQNGTLSGPGWERLVEEGRKARFFLVGEEHGVAEIPAVVRELFRTLQPAGYRHLAIEISPPMAAVLDEIARGADGLQKLSRFFQENPPGVAFFTLKEEAELLVAARAAVPGREPVFWGLDYESPPTVIFWTACAGGLRKGRRRRRRKSFTNNRRRPGRRSPRRRTQPRSSRSRIHRKSSRSCARPGPIPIPRAPEPST